MLMSLGCIKPRLQVATRCTPRKMGEEVRKQHIKKKRNSTFEFINLPL